MSCIIRKPNKDDGKHIWAIARDTGTLDLNSPYAYLLSTTHFRDTCAVAVEHNTIVGFVYAYRLPQSPLSLFVWQIGVHPEHQGKGIAFKMLTELIKRENCTDITHIDATIAPTNLASNKLFKNLAKEMNTSISNLPYFGAEHFPSGEQIENYVSVGPIN